MSDKRRSIKSETSNQVEQAHRADADINRIMARWVATRHLPSLEKRAPMYGDFTEVPSFQEACDLVSEMKQSFSELPASIRRRFDNNPQTLLNWIQDPGNLEEGRELGIFEPEVFEEPRAADESRQAAVRGRSGPSPGAPAESRPEAGGAAEGGDGTVQ